MNFLAHAYLSFGNTDLLTGNMIADHVKGRAALAEFPEGIQQGMLLHRKIDAFTDEHPATQRAKVLFRPDYHLYSGPILDVIFDHFLANDPQHFASQEALKIFTANTYKNLESNEAYFPQAFANYFPYMKEHNWLLGYRNLQGIQKALKGLERKAKYLGDTQKAYEIFIGYYYQINQAYFELMDDLVKYVKNEIAGGHT